MSEEIRGCLVEVDSCFRLLLPFDLGPFLGAAPPTTACAVSEGGALCPAGTPDLGDEEQPCCSKTLPACARLPGATSGEELCQASTGALSEEEEEEDSDQEEFVRHHGLGSHKYTLDVELCSGNVAPAPAWGPLCPQSRLLLHQTSWTTALGTLPTDSLGPRSWQGLLRLGRGCGSPGPILGPSL